MIVNNRISATMWRLSRCLIAGIQNRMATINHTPVFVLGNQKSGTTAIAGLLSAATGCSVTLDTKGIYEPVQTKLHANELQIDTFIQDNRLDFSRQIIKEPCFTFLYDKLHTYFSRATFIIVIRDPRDNIRSILNRLDIPGQLSSIDVANFPAVTPEWQLILDGSWMGLSGTNHIEMLSQRWNRSAEVYLHHKDNIHLIKYEDFMLDKENSICNLAVSVGLTPTYDIRDKVDYRFQPKGDSHISWQDFYSEENLLSIEKLCGERMKSFGYKPLLLCT